MDVLDILKAIQEHIGVINDELGRLDVRVAVLETQMYQILGLQRLILGAVILAIVGALLAPIIRRKNHKHETRKTSQS